MAYRREKLEEQIKRLVSELMIKEIKDPRIGFATITGVTINRDFTLARIGISVFGEPRDLRKTLEGLNSARNFIQFRIAKALEIRHSPRIEFFLDSSLCDGVNMVGLLNSIEDARPEEEPDEEFEKGSDKESDDDSVVKSSD
jgi:ribosome-binding factor A